MDALLNATKELKNRHNWTYSKWWKRQQRGKPQFVTWLVILSTVLRIKSSCVQSLYSLFAFKEKCEVQHNHLNRRYIVTRFAASFFPISKSWRRFCQLQRPIKCENQDACSGKCFNFPAIVLIQQQFTWNSSNSIQLALISFASDMCLQLRCMRGLSHVFSFLFLQ